MNQKRGDEPLKLTRATDEDEGATKPARSTGRSVEPSSLTADKKEQTKRTIMRMIIMIPHFALSLVLLLLAVWLVFVIGRYYYRLVVKPIHKIVFVPFEAGGQKNQDAPQQLSAKLRQLQVAGTQAPSGYGFRTMPTLAALPREADKGASNTLAQLENISLRIKDVDVSQLIQTVTSIYEPPQYELGGRIVDLTNALEISCELIRAGVPIARWQSRVKYQTDANKDESLPDKAGATDKALDEILFQMIFDFLNKDDFKDWGITMKGDDPPKNWQTLRAYTRGVQSLRAYQDSLDHSDLKEAIDHLALIPIVAPDSADGLYYYGLALSEDRQEAEAVEVFEQLERLIGARLDSDGEGPQNQTAEAKLDLEKMKLESRLNRASALIEQYDWKAGLRASDELDKLVTDLEKNTVDIPERRSDDQWYYTKLLTLAHAQRAYTKAALIAIKKEDTAFGDQWNKKIGADIESAEKHYKSIKDRHKWSSEREDHDVDFRIKNARGYSTFRIAQHSHSRHRMQQATSSDTFVSDCNTAIETLKAANHARANHYLALQNMAMIYENEDFDPLSQFIDKAEALYERTKRIVPNDYYQYEHLAQIQFRRLKPLAASADSKPLIQKGKDYALKAIAVGPRHAARARYLMAEFNVILWDISRAENASEAAKLAIEATSYFQQALNMRSREEFRQAYLAFVEKQKAASPTDLKPRLEYGAFLVSLAKRDDQQKRELLEEATNVLTTVIADAGKASPPKQDILDKASNALNEAAALLAALPAAPP